MHLFGKRNLASVQWAACKSRLGVGKDAGGGVGRMAARGKFVLLLPDSSAAVKAPPAPSSNRPPNQSPDRAVDGCP